MLQYSRPRSRRCLRLLLLLWCWSLLALSGPLLLLATTTGLVHVLAADLQDHAAADVGQAHAEPAPLQEAHAVRAAADLPAAPAHSPLPPQILLMTGVQSQLSLAAPGTFPLGTPPYGLVTAAFPPSLASVAVAAAGSGAPGSSGATAAPTVPPWATLSYPLSGALPAPDPGAVLSVSFSSPRTGSRVRACMAMAGTGLQILDFSADPSQPQVAGTVSGPVGSVTFVSYLDCSLDDANGLVWASSPGEGIVVFDIRAGFAQPPPVIATYSLFQYAMLVSFSPRRTLALVCDQNLGAWLVNGSNLNQTVWGSGALDCVDAQWMSEEVLLVGRVTMVVMLWNVSSVNATTAPATLATYVCAAPVLSLSLLGVHMALVLLDTTSFVLDISVLTNPTLMYYVTPLNSGRSSARVRASRGCIYMCMLEHGLDIYNLSLPSLLALPLSYSFLQRQRLMLTAWSWDDSNTVGPPSLLAVAQATTRLNVDQPLQSVINVLVDRSMLPMSSTSFYISSGPLFLNPSPYLLNLSLRITTKSSAVGTGSSSGTSAGSAGPTFTLTLDPGLVGTIASQLGEAGAIAAVPGSNLIYVADFGGGVQMVDVTSPLNPVILGYFAPPGSGSAPFLVQSVTVDPLARYALVLNAESGLVAVFNISAAVGSASAPAPASPRAPQMLGWASFFNNTSQPIVLRIVGTLLLMVDADGLFIYEYNGDPLAVTVLLSSLPLPLPYSLDVGVGLGGVTGALTLAFVGGSEALHVVEFSNPTAPVVVGSSGTGFPDFLGVSAAGSYIFAAGGDNLLYIFSLTAAAPTQPQSQNTRFLLTLMACYRSPPPASLSGVLARGPYLYLATGTSGTEVRDLGRFTFAAISNSTQDAGNYEISVTATDALGATTVTNPFTFRIQGPPVFNRGINPQYAKVGQSFTYFVPQGLCTDPNLDAIAFTATQRDGSDLPAWLTFNSISSTFAGSPGDPDVGLRFITIFATDHIAGTSQITFSLQVNHLPVVVNPLIPLSLRIGRPFNFPIPFTTFSPPDSYLNTTYAIQMNEQPSWLKIDGALLSLSGTPTNDSKSSYSLTVTISNNLSDSASASLTLNVFKNKLPQVVQPISDQQAQVNTAFQFSVATNTFSVFAGDTLFVNASASDGAPLPSWLSFDNRTLTFSGQPTRADTDPFTPRSVAINVYAYNLPFSPPADPTQLRYTTASFHIVVSGTSWVLLAVQILAPIFSILLTSFTLYRQRALFLNPLARQKGKYRTESRGVRVGDDLRAELRTPLSLVCAVWVGIPNPQHPAALADDAIPFASAACDCREFSRSFLHPRLLRLPGGIRMPRWMEYHQHSNSLRSRGPVPPDALDEVLLVQVQDDAGLIVEEFLLRILSSDAPPLPPSGVFSPGRSERLDEQQHRLPQEIEMHTILPPILQASDAEVDEALGGARSLSENPIHEAVRRRTTALSANAEAAPSAYAPSIASSEKVSLLALQGKVRQLEQLLATLNGETGAQF